MDKYISLSDKGKLDVFDVNKDTLYISVKYCGSKFTIHKEGKLMHEDDVGTNINDAAMMLEDLDKLYLATDDDIYIIHYLKDRYDIVNGCSKRATQQNILNLQGL